MSDKNQEMVDYLMQCDYIKTHPLFFNFGNAKNGNSQLVINGNDVAQDEKYVDGSVLRRYSCNLLVYKSISYNPVVKEVATTSTPLYPNENVEELADVQAIIDWIKEQNDSENFPDFGEDCVVEHIEALTTNPAMNGVNSSMTPP